MDDNSEATADALHQRLREVRDDLPELLAVRLHRAVSWLRCAAGQEDNLDLRFIALWISFNACYGVDEDRPSSLGERDVFQRFVHKLVKHDEDKRIYRCLWETWSGPVRALLRNRYVFAPFWEAQRGIHNDWETRFDKATAAANNALSRQQVPDLLSMVLDRLYVLRNQLMHGGATWQSQVNREQVRDGVNMLATLMPILIAIMLAAADENWGEIYYPVVG